VKKKVLSPREGKQTACVRGVEKMALGSQENLPFLPEKERNRQFGAAEKGGPRRKEEERKGGVKQGSRAGHRRRKKTIGLESGGGGLLEGEKNTPLPGEKKPKQTPRGRGWVKAA